MLKGVTVYYLLDPPGTLPVLPGQHVYVGISKCPEIRFKCSHLRETAMYPDWNTHKINWIRSLQVQSLQPILSIQCWVETAKEAKRLEVLLIAKLRTRGCKVVNSTDGGDGFIGGHHSEKTRKIMSEHNAFKGKPGIMLGKHHSEESCQLISEHNARKGKEPWNKGKEMSEETCQLISDHNARKGKPAWNKGEYSSEETCQSISDALRGVPKSESHRASMRAVWVRRKAKEAAWEKAWLTGVRDYLAWSEEYDAIIEAKDV